MDGELSAANSARRGSAWEELLSEDPGIVDDAGVSWLERLALHVLTSGQGRAYLKGARAEGLVLGNGQTPAEYLRGRLNPPAGLFVALPGGCELFAGEQVTPGDVRAVEVRRQCRLPERATALLVTVRAESPNPLRVKLWAADLPEPAGKV